MRTVDRRYNTGSADDYLSRVSSLLDNDDVTHLAGVEERCQEPFSDRGKGVRSRSLIAAKVVGERSSVNRAHVAAHPRPHESNGYAIWDIMRDRRTTRRPNILWHDCDAPIDYCRAALQFGLSYEEKDFEDPNQGCGLGMP